MGSFWYECGATAERCSCIYSGQPRRAVVVGPCPDVRPSRDQKPADLREPRRKGKFLCKFRAGLVSIAVAPTQFCAEIWLPLPFALMTSLAAPDVGLQFVFCPLSFCFM